MLTSIRKSSISKRRAGWHPVIEPMEQRVLMSAVTFTIDPSQSSITLSGSAVGFTLQEQAPGSLTTSYSGTVQADVASGAISLTAGSAITASVNGTWQPGNAPGDYGGKFSAGILGSGVAAGRDLVFDATSAAIPVAADGSFDATNISISATAGHIDYDATLLGKHYTGSVMASGQSAQNQAMGGMYTVSGGTATLTIPVSVTLQYSALTPNDTQATFTGKIVATAPVAVAPKLLSTTFSDGTKLDQVQRSEVRQIAFTFDQAVNLASGAVSLALLNVGGSGTDNGAPPTDASAALGTPVSHDGGVTWTVPILKNTSFSDATGSLDDGIYTVTLKSDDVTAKSGGATLAGPDMHSTTFHRLFGDITGSKTVNNGDYLLFKKSYLTSTGDPKFNADFDYDANGTINNADFLQFKKRYLKKFTY